MRLFWLTISGEVAIRAQRCFGKGYGDLEAIEAINEDRYIKN